MRRLFPILSGWPLIGLLLIAACHDAPRKNPFDPALTPPVALSAVALDDTAGTALLTWTPYGGRQPFAEYWVLRKIQGLEAVDTLAVLTDLDQTSFADTSVIQGIAYLYRVSVVNNAGFEVSSPQREAAVLELPAPRVTKADFDSRSATASLEWAPYAGPHFAAYELTRSTSSASQLVAEFSDISATMFRDSGLVGNTSYTYELSVRTDRDERTPGDTVTGSLHPLVASWPIDIQTGDLEQESMHLYASPGNRVHLLYAEQGIARLRTFDPEGQQLGKDLVPELFFGRRRSLAAAIGPDGARYLSLVGTSTANANESAFSSPGVMLFGTDGQAVLREPELVADSLPAELGASGAQIILDTNIFAGLAHFDNVTVTQQGMVVLAEGFDDVPGNWNFGGTAEILDGRLKHGRGYSSWVERVDGDFVMEADVSVLSLRAGIRIDWRTVLGGYRLLLLAFGNEAQLLRQTENDEMTVAAIPYPVIAEVLYRLRLGAVDGHLTASVQSPLLWQGKHTAAAPTWTSLAVIDGRIALTIDEQPYVLDADGQAMALSPLDDWVSEIRVWDRGDGRGQAIGVCLPEANQVQLTDPLRGQPGQWTNFLRQQIGPRVGERNGFIFYPLSFDIGPDGRIYILDAGNARIVVFDEEGNFITEWGSKGSGEDRFDFGEGVPLLDKGYSFAGSIAVDDDGFIYVADVGNGRIQKFAP